MILGEIVMTLGDYNPFKPKEDEEHKYIVSNGFGRLYELKRSYAGKYGAYEWAAEIRKNGYYPNRRGLARVFRLKDGGWGVFVAYGDRI